MRSAKTGIGWVWPGLIGAAGVSVLLFGYVPSEDGTGLFTIVQVVVSTLVAGLGSVIAAHQPGNRIVWLLRATAVGLLLSVAVSLSVEFGAPPVSPGFWDYAAAAVFNLVASLILFPIVLILFVFPTGRFLSRRWTLAGWIAGVFTAVMCFVVLFGDEAGKIYDPESKNWHLTNPIGFLPRGIGEFMTSAAVGVSMWLAVGGVVSMIIRYRRSDSLVRTQIKWVVYASAIAALALASTSFSGGDETIFLVLSLTALSVIPVAITLAITRYQLYEIDRLISRTVSYGLVIALLGGVFATLTWLPSVLIGGVDDGGASASAPPVLVAASTLAVAALFNPLRRRIQHVVDRRFNRSGYQAEVVSEEFAAKMREPLSSQEITDLWRRTVEETVQPRAAGVWLKDL